jgi:tRNA G10  N-methylase Trm11
MGRLQDVCVNMKYIFILGRNIELSVAEVKAFFRRHNLAFKEIGLANNGFLVETNREIPEDSIDKLGGVVSIGKVLAEGKAKHISEDIDKQTIYFGEENKMNYVIFDFDAKDPDNISFYLKQKFKKEKLKATEKKLTGSIRLQGKGFVPNVASKNIDEQYFIFQESFGRIIQKSNYEKIEQRDMNKPVRRNELSISPRLAKILINLAEVKSGETLLDPFCGIGVILEEALLQNIHVIGVDKDKKAVSSARENLRWFGFKDEDYRLISDDSSIAKLPFKVNGIATEPDLGELQKGTPSKEKATSIARGFERLMVNVLKNLKINVKGKIVFTAPLISTGKERISCDFKGISERAGMKIVEGPIHEFRDDSIVGRDIVVMRR